MKINKLEIYQMTWRDLQEELKNVHLGNFMTVKQIGLQALHVCMYVCVCAYLYEFMRVCMCICVYV